MTRRRMSDTARGETALSTGGEVQTSSDYQVGYGKPPKETRFKPGQSGNPRGRPKGAQNVETILRKELLGPITVVEDGRRRKVPRLVALIRRLMEKAFGGDVRAGIRLLEFATRLAPEEIKAAVGRDMLPDESDLLDLLTARATRLAAEGGERNGGGDHE
ncbi:MAG: DUF5681 domain-containing protein [Alsobacter sp.]